MLDTTRAFLPSSLGNEHRCGDAFPLGRQTGKIVGDSGEIAIDRSGMAVTRVSRRIFQRRGQFFLLSFQGRDFHFEVVDAFFFFAPRFGNRIARFRFQTFLRFLLP